MRLLCVSKSEIIIEMVFGFMVRPFHGKSLLTGESARSVCTLHLTRTHLIDAKMENFILCDVFFEKSSSAKNNAQLACVQWFTYVLKRLRQCPYRSRGSALPYIFMVSGGRQWRFSNVIRVAMKEKFRPN